MTEMSTINIFNILNNLTELVNKNYIYKNSDLNSFEKNLARSLFETLENSIFSISEDFEEGELIDYYSNMSDSEIENDPEISDFENEIEEKKVWILPKFTEYLFHSFRNR
jgi:hypothetical protein